MLNLLHEMCVQTSRLAQVHKQIDVLTAESRQIITELALYAGQSAAEATHGHFKDNSNEPTN